MIHSERTEFLSGGLRAHPCAACGAEVLVKKNSMVHTSIQWTTDAASACPVFAQRASNGVGAALLRSCERLTASIDSAALRGEFGEIDG